MSGLAAALLAELDDQALDELARLLAPRLAALEPVAERAGWLRPAAAAEYLGCTKKRVHDLKSSGALEPDGYDGSVPLYLRETLDAYARGRR